MQTLFSDSVGVLLRKHYAVVAGLIASRQGIFSLCCLFVGGLSQTLCGLDCVGFAFKMDDE